MFLLWVLAKAMIALLSAKDFFSLLLNFENELYLFYFIKKILESLSKKKFLKRIRNLKSLKIKRELSYAFTKKKSVD